MKSEDKINLKEEEVMCDSKEITCETMMCWNLGIGMIGCLATSFRCATVEKNKWKNKINVGQGKRKLE